VKRVRIGWAFVGANVSVWLAMVCILVLLPDQLERWLPLQVCRVIGWAVACGVWVVTVEQQWRARYGPFVRFALQLVLWVSAAVFALWLDDQFRLTW
jgi:hypothetical protein